MVKKKLTPEQEQEKRIQAIMRIQLGCEIPAFLKRDVAEHIYYKENPYYVRGNNTYESRIKLFETNYQMQRADMQAQCIHQLLIMVALLERDVDELKATVNYINNHYEERRDEE